jgi:hypothetical protein
VTVSTLYSFSEIQNHRIGSLVTDRDAFLLLFEIARSSKPLSLAKLCCRFRISPDVFGEVFDELASLGMAANQSGTYKATDFGLAAIDFIENVANSFRLPLQLGVSAGDPIQVLGLAAEAGTNNTVRGTFSDSVSVVSTTPIIAKNTSLGATDDKAASMRSEGPKVENAPRNYNRM